MKYHHEQLPPDDPEWSDFGRDPYRPWVLEYVIFGLILILAVAWWATK